MRNANVYNRRILKAAILAIVVLCMLTMHSTIYHQIAYATDDIMPFDTTSVMDDLNSSTVNGERFNILAYPYNELSDIQVINFVEFCYSYKANMRGNYALYIYVYNPKGRNIVGDSRQNKIQMATEYDAGGNPSKYHKYNLKFCSVSEGNYKNLFYKFRVVDAKVDGKLFHERVNSLERRYDVSGIELLTYGKQNATEYGVGGTYKFTGYAEGYGPDEKAKSTLSCVVEELETIDLEVHHTYYRTNVSSLGVNHYNEVNTVYFSVPDRFYQKYGTLQKIRAEWWEYKTKPMIVTSSQAIYDLLAKYTGYQLKPTHASRPVETPVYNYLDFSVPFYIYSMDGMNTRLQDGKHVGFYAYNMDLRYLDLSSKKLGKHNFTCEKSADMIPYVFYSSVASGDGFIDAVLDWFMSPAIAGDVKASRVADYIYSYTNDLGHGYMDCNGRQIYKDLFEDSVDFGRTMGYNDKEIDFEDTFDLHSYDSNHSWWDKLWDYGFHAPKTDGDVTVSPIYEMTEGDYSLSNDKFSKQLLVNSNDVADLKKFYVEEKLKGNHVILFRFANTDYFTADTLVTSYSQDISGSNNTYVAQMTVFFDFDIISLTFNKDGVYRVIPAVSSPIDIINGITAPPRMTDWWKIILAILMLVLLIILIAPLLPYIIKGIAWVVSLPFKAVKSCVESAKQRKAERKFMKELREGKEPKEEENEDS